MIADAAALTTTACDTNILFPRLLYCQPSSLSLRSLADDDDDVPVIIPHPPQDVPVIIPPHSQHISQATPSGPPLRVTNSVSQTPPSGHPLRVTNVSNGTHFLMSKLYCSVSNIIRYNAKSKQETVELDEDYVPSSDSGSQVSAMHAYLFAVVINGTNPLNNSLFKLLQYSQGEHLQ